MNKQTEIIIYSITGVSLIATLVIIILCFKRIAQSIKGTMGESFFTIDELCQSDTAERYNIDNTPTPEAKENLQALIDNVLNPVRKSYGSYIKVNSGYRCSKLNAKVGGVASSQHTTGEAADITGGSIANNKKIFQAIAELGVYDQLIWEKGGKWVHVSYKRSGNNRLAMLNYNGSSYTNINNNWQNVVLT